MTSRERTTIRRIETCAFDAWPAFETISYDGWIARFAHGYTKRANSVNAIEPTGSFARTLATSRAHFRERGLRVTFRLTHLAPPRADAMLAGAGFVRLDETLVMTAEIGTVDMDRLERTVASAAKVDFRTAAARTDVNAGSYRRYQAQCEAATDSA